MGTGRFVPTSRWRPLSGVLRLQLYLGVGLHQDPEGRGRVTGQVHSRHRVRGRVQHSPLRYRPRRVHSQDLAGGCGRGAQPQELEAAAQ